MCLNDFRWVRIFFSVADRPLLTVTPRLLDYAFDYTVFFPSVSVRLLDDSRSHLAIGSLLSLSVTQILTGLDVARGNVCRSPSL